MYNFNIIFLIINLLELSFLVPQHVSNAWYASRPMWIYFLLFYISLVVQYVARWLCVL